MIIHVQNLRIAPAATMRKPWRFESLADAQLFSRISSRKVWAVCPEFTGVLEIYPGGRCTRWTYEQTAAWLRRTGDMR